MVVSFPAAKLGLLAIRQLSRYVGNYIKDKAKENYAFRTYICMPPAQAYNYIEVKTKMWALRLGRPTRVTPLTEAAAIDLGASMLGEFIVFAICSGVVIVELSRSRIAENRKREELRQEKLKIMNDLLEMEEILQTQEIYIEELSKALEKLGQPVGHKKKKKSKTQDLKVKLEEHATEAQTSLAEQ